MANDNLFVYVLRSERVPDRYYTGMSDDVECRLAVHNSGGSKYTCKLRPWKMIVSLNFSNPASAIAFEQYLKTGSGRAFSKRHFV
jgi:putative endonuclease